MRRVLGEAATPLTSLVELPGRGATRVWECPGPRRAETLMLIHGVAVTAELNWGKVLAPLARYFRVIAADLRGHGDGIRVGSRFRLEDCADDVAALAAVLGIRKFVAVGYSMGGMVAQLLARRHAGPIGVPSALLLHPDTECGLDDLGTRPSGAPHLSQPRAQRKSEALMVRGVCRPLREWGARHRYHRLRGASLQLRGQQYDAAYQGLARRGTLEAHRCRKWT